MKVYALFEMSDYGIDDCAQDILIRIYANISDAMNDAKDLIKENIYDKLVKQNNGKNSRNEKLGYTKRHTIADFPEWWENSFYGKSIWKTDSYINDTRPILDLGDYYLEEVEFIPAS